jgi:hypothetical protein
MASTNSSSLSFSMSESGRGFLLRRVKSMSRAMVTRARVVFVLVCSCSGVVRAWLAEAGRFPGRRGCGLGFVWEKRCREYRQSRKRTAPTRLVERIRIGRSGKK